MKIHTQLTLLALLLSLPALRAAAQVPAQTNYQGRVAVGGVNFNGTGQFKFALVDGGVNQNQTATATAITGPGNGISSITIINGGSGYASAPTVTITGAGGSGATATAHLGGGGFGNVAFITIDNPGSGYSTIPGPTVTIAPPPANVVTTSFWSNDGTSNAGSEPTAAVPLAVMNGLYAVALGDTALANMSTGLPASVFDNPDVRLRVWFDDGTHGSQLLSPDQRFGTVPYAFRAALAQAVPANSITSTQLADGAVTSTKLGGGAVGNAQIAAGAINPAKLAGSSPESGQVLSYDAANSTFKWVAAGAGFTLPVYADGAEAQDYSLFYLYNQGDGDAIFGESSGGRGSSVRAPVPARQEFTGLVALVTDSMAKLSATDTRASMVGITMRMGATGSLVTGVASL